MSFTTLWNEQLVAIQWSVVILAALVAAVSDLRTRRIPNWLTIPLWMGGLAFAGMRHGSPGLFDAMTASVILAIPYIALFLFANGGAGDAKLMGAVGAWLGIINGLVALACVAMIGVVVAVAYVMWTPRTSVVVADLGRQEGTGLGSAESSSAPLTIPYGVPIFLGVLASAIGVFIWRA